MKPRISVLMAIYNCADTLSEAIDSLYNQTYKNFKLILCDDGSSDNTFEIAQDYAEKYDNIVLLRNKENIKLAASLNRCLEYADTEYVARMDGDDISLPTRFEKEIDFLDKNPQYVLVSCPMAHFDERGIWSVSKATEIPNINNFKRGTPYAHAPCMIRTKILKEVNGYTVAKYTERGQDYYLWYKIHKKGYQGYNLSESLYQMRDDMKAIKRRTFRVRYWQFIRKNKVLRGLGVRNSWFYAFPSLLKAFIPPKLMKPMRKIKRRVRRKLKTNIND